MNIPTKTPAELNIKNQSILDRQGVYFMNIKSEPFRIYGLFEPTLHDRFMRMPAEISEAVSYWVNFHNYETPGGRVRFTTDSDFLAIRAFMPAAEHPINMNLIGKAGFDVYVRRNGRETYAMTLKTDDPDFSDGFEACGWLPHGGVKEVTINFPLYHGVNDLWIGLDNGASVGRHPDYRVEKPVIYYGSSITQGGCASRPGMSYEAIISRRLDVDYMNFGFAGCCKAEEVLADHLASLDRSVFVLDYDHNAPNAEYLENTHEKTYRKIHDAHPDLPVVIVTKPDFDPAPGDAAKRRDVIYTTYRNALARGEKVIFVDGQSLFQGEMREDCTVDGCHPNDLGMTRMADVIGKAVDSALAMIK